jgi:hypothetical protein
VRCVPPRSPTLTLDGSQLAGLATTHGKGRYQTCNLRNSMCDRPVIRLQQAASIRRCTHLRGLRGRTGGGCALRAARSASRATLKPVTEARGGGGSESGISAPVIKVLGRPRVRIHGDSCSNSTVSRANTLPSLSGRGCVTSSSLSSSLVETNPGSDVSELLPEDSATNDEGGGRFCGMSVPRFGAALGLFCRRNPLRPLAAKGT